MKLHRILIALAVAALLFSACGGSSSETANANYAELDFGDSDSAVVAAPGGPAAAVTVAHEPPPANAVDEATLDELTAIYDSYLRLRSSAVVAEDDSTDLSDVATQAAIDQVAAERAENEAAHAAEKYSAMTGLFQWSNVTTIEERGSEFVFVDCTERQERNSAGTPVLTFVTNEVVMVAEGDVHKVDQVTRLQSGVFAAFVGDFGCVPPSFVERAETVAAAAITEVAAMFADPGAAMTQGVPDTFTDEARDELSFLVDQLNEQGLSRVADEQIEVQVVGMDTNKPDFTVIVSVCRHYPNGRAFTDATTGQSTASDIARGGSEEDWLFVQLESVPVGTPSIDTVTRVESKSTNCWNG